jgi:hypothetical protein
VAIPSDERIGAGNRRKKYDQPGSTGLQVSEIEEQFFRMAAKGCDIEERRMNVAERVSVDLFSEDAETPGRGGEKGGIGIDLLAGVVLGVMLLTAEMEDRADVLFDGAEGLVVAELQDKCVHGLLTEMAQQRGIVVKVDGRNRRRIDVKAGLQHNPDEAGGIPYGEAVDVTAPSDDDVMVRLRRCGSGAHGPVVKP